MIVICSEFLFPSKASQHGEARSLYDQCRARVIMIFKSCNAIAWQRRRPPRLRLRRDPPPGSELTKTDVDASTRNDQPFRNFWHKRIVYLDDRKRCSNVAPGPLSRSVEQKLCDEIEARRSGWCNSSYGSRERVIKIGKRAGRWRQWLLLKLRGSVLPASWREITGRRAGRS